MEIAPGANVTVEITARPRSAAAAKTLTRVCAKDADVKKRKRHRKAHRPSWIEWIRGGKYWHHQMKSKPGISLAPGAKYSLRATVDVIRDLESVQRCVKVTAD